MAEIQRRYFRDRLVEGVTVVGLAEPMSLEVDREMQEVRGIITRTTEGGRQPLILFDLQGTRDFAATFLGLISGWKKLKDAGGELHLCSCEASVIQVYQIHRLTGIIALHPGRWDDPGLIARAFRHTFTCEPLPAECLALNDAAVGKMARTVAEERAFGEVPILADALEEAGCTDQALLDHCRHAGEHLPGCWALAMLGRVE